MAEVIQPVIDTEEEALQEPEFDPFARLKQLATPKNPLQKIKEMSNREPQGFMDFVTGVVSNKKVLKAPNPLGSSNLNKQDEYDIKVYGHAKPTDEEKALHARSEQIAASLPPSSISLDPDLKERQDRLYGEAEKQLGVDQPIVDFQRQRRAQIDLSPLMNWIDSSSKSQKTLRGYKAPKTGEELASENIALENVLQKQREGLLDNLAKQQYNRAARAQADVGGKEAERERQRQFGLIKEAGKAVNGAGTAYDTVRSMHEKIEAVINSGDYKQLKQILGNYAKYIGGTVGAQSDKDIANQMSPSITGFMTQIKSFLNAKGGNQMDPRDLQAFRANLDRAKEAARTAHASQLKTLYGTYANMARSAGFGTMADEGTPFHQMFETEAKKSANHPWYTPEGGFQGNEEELRAKPNEIFVRLTKVPKAQKLKINPKTGKPYPKFGDVEKVDAAVYEKLSPQEKQKWVQVEKPPQEYDTPKAVAPVPQQPVMPQEQYIPETIPMQGNQMLDPQTMQNLQMLINRRR